MFSLVVPSHIVVVVEEDRFSNAIGDTANMPYVNSIASSSLVYSNSHGLNKPSQDGEMSYLALYSGSTQGETGDGIDGPYSGANLAQELYNGGKSFVGYAEAMPHNGDTTDHYGASPTNPAYDDLYMEAYNPMAQFSNDGKGITNAQVNQTFASFPTTAAGYAALPTVSFVIPDTMDNTHGSNDTSPYATDPGNYNLFRQTADTWLKNNLNGYLQWAKQNNSLLIITTDEGDRNNGFTSLATNDITTIVAGSTNLLVPGVDSTSITPYNILRTIEDMYGLKAMGSTSSAADLDTNASGLLAAPSAKVASATNLATSTASAVYGQSVTFTATVTGTGSTPTGTVTFNDGSTMLGTGTLNASGVATLTTSTFAVASHSITASYSGNSAFNASTSSALTETVAKDATTGTVNSSFSPSVFGQSVTFSATIAASTPGAGMPTGTVQFKVDGANFGSAVSLSGAIASVVISSLAVGSHSISAVYGGDGNFTTSTASVTQSVSKAATTTVITSSAGASQVGQPVTFTAKVSPVAPGAGTETGSVQFVIDGANFGSPVALSSGVATSAAITTLAAGSHAVVAIYSGDASFTASTSSAFTQTVGANATTTSVASSANPAVFGQSLMLTATVLAPSGGTPTGTVTFKDGSTTLGTASLAASGLATWSTSSLPVASHSITAVYSGDSSFAGSASSALMQIVNQASTSTALSTSLSPAVFGQSVTFTARMAVTGAGSGTPTGTVQFKDGTIILGTGALNAGVATFTTSSLAVATHSITAVYNGDGNFLSSTSAAVTETINPATVTAAPLHIVIVIENTRFSGAVGDANLPYLNQLASTGLVYSNDLGLNDPSVTAQMDLLALFSGSSQGVTDNGYDGPFAGGNLAQSLFNRGLTFGGYTEALPSAGDTTDAYAASPTNPAYDDLYNRAYNPMAQFSNFGTGITNVMVNQPFSAFPTTAAGYTALPTVSFVIPDTLDSTKGSNDTSPYGTDSGSYALLRQNADNFLKNNLDGYLQWAKQNNSLLIVTEAEADRSRGFTSQATNLVTTVVNGSTNLFVPGVDPTAYNHYNLLRTIEDMYGLTPLGGSASVGDLHLNSLHQLAAPAATSMVLALGSTPTVFGQAATFTATVTGTGAGTPTGLVTFLDGTTILGTGALNSAGIATFMISSLAVGTHSITARYGGDGFFNASVSSAASQVVNQAASITTLASSSPTSTAGQSVVFSATLAAIAPGAGAPTGTVQFVVDGVNLGTPAAIINGVATSSALSSLSVGTHSILAIYSGDADFVASTAATLTQTVISG
jgi:hypothetical protein